MILIILDPGAESSSGLASLGELSKLSIIYSYIHTCMHVHTYAHTHTHILLWMIHDALDKVESLIGLLVESNQVPPEKQVCAVFTAYLLTYTYAYTYICRSSKRV